MNNTKMNKNKVVLGMSGGIDSSVSLLILKEQGYEIIGVYFIMYKHKENTSAYIKQQQDINDAKKLANFAGIEFKIIDISKEFEDEVISYFVREYANGRTPNPCMVCNRKIKMKYLIDVADKENAYYIATGHYAGIEDTKYGKVLLKGEEIAKDQSYFLANINRKWLDRIIFPLAKYEDKEKVKVEYSKIYNEIQKNKKEKDIIQNKKESQDICFIKDMNYQQFIEEYVLDKKEQEQEQENKNKNNISKEITELKDVDIYFEDKYLTKGKKIYSYTIGKRKGLNIALNKKVYVTKLDSKNNRVYLGEIDKLKTKEVLIKDINLLIQEDKLKEILANNKILTVKLNYNAKAQECTLNLNKITNSCKIILKEYVRKPSSGQYAVIYLDNIILFSGEIV